MILPTSLLSSQYIVCDSCEQTTSHSTFIDGKNHCLMFQCRECGWCVSDNEATLDISVKEWYRITFFDWSIRHAR